MLYKKMFTLILILFIPISIYAQKELNFTYWGSTFEKKAVEDVIDDFNKIKDEKIISVSFKE